MKVNFSFQDVMEVVHNEPQQLDNDARTKIQRRKTLKLCSCSIE